MTTQNSYVRGARLAEKWRRTPGVFFSTPLPGVGDCKYTVTKPDPNKYATIKELAARTGKTERCIEGIITREKVSYIIHEIPGKVPMTRYYVVSDVSEAMDKADKVKDVNEFDSSKWAMTPEALSILGYKNKASLNKLSNNGILNPERARTENGRIINMYSRAELCAYARP